MPTSALQERLLQQRGNGIEEEKEEMDIIPSAMSDGAQGGPAEPPSLDAVGDEYGFRAQLESFARILFGSCGYVLEAAVHSCRAWPSSARDELDAQRQYAVPPVDPREPPPPAPLSIADELRRLAAQNPAAQYLYQQPPRGDIPKFLGEDAVYSFDDDNISAISAHTLEEMEQRAKQRCGANGGMVHPICRPRRQSSDSSKGPSSSRPSESRQEETVSTKKDDDGDPPSPARTHSASTSTTHSSSHKHASTTPQDL